MALSTQTEGLRPLPFWRYELSFKMATVIPGGPRLAPKHFGLFRTNVGGDLPVIVRRSCGDPSFWRHEKSPRVREQRIRFAEASQHYATLTPPQRWLSKRRYRDVPFVDNHGKSSLKLLSGRQLVISEDIASLRVTGQFTEQPFQVCIILCRPDYEPLVGELHLEYNDGAFWHEVEGRELNLGNWLFVEVPGKMAAYRVWGEAVGWQDPMLPAYQNMTEKELKAHHWHIMEVPIVTMEFAHRFFPDPFPRSPAVDGSVGFWGPYAGVTWDEMMDGPANEASAASGTMNIGVTASRTANKWRGLREAILMFDTQEIPLYAEITEAWLRLWCYSKTVQAAPEPNSIIIVQAFPGQYHDITINDYRKMASGSLCGEPFPIINLVYHEWNHFQFSEYGLEQIKKAGVTCLGIRNYEYDALDEEPPWHKSFHIYCQFRTGEGGYEYCPILDVKYTAPIVPEV